MDSHQARKFLNVNDDATIDEIKAEYKRLALKHHPDKNVGNDDRMFRRINEAYNVLKEELLGPSNTEEHDYEMGIDFFRECRYVKAIEYFDRVRDVNPYAYMPHITRCRGFAQFQLDCWNAAIKSFDSVLKTDKEFMNTDYYLESYCYIAHSAICLNNDRLANDAYNKLQQTDTGEDEKKNQTKYELLAELKSRFVERLGDNFFKHTMRNKTRSSRRTMADDFDDSYDVLKMYRGYLKDARGHYGMYERTVDNPLYQRRPGSQNIKSNSVWIKLDISEALFQSIRDSDTGLIEQFTPSGVSTRYTEDRFPILEINPGEKSILIEGFPTLPKLRIILRHPSAIVTQQAAVKKLQFKPVEEYWGILKLFNSKAKWKGVKKEDVREWFVLKDENMEGVDQQRKFVKIALGTPDFAFLDGPPGSGKTTVMCELVQQLIHRGKRVLFCASTHVAIDNLLERFITEEGDPVNGLLPLRVGNSSKISKRVEEYRYDNFAQRVLDDMRLQDEKRPTNAQKKMLDILNDPDSVKKMIWDNANLICGTTIGVSKYLRGSAGVEFDFMIIDEASKTTIQEFLVPAVHAKRWIVSGDVRQLTPYVDQEELANTLDISMDSMAARVCLDVFLAHKDNTIIVINPDRDMKKYYTVQDKGSLYYPGKEDRDPERGDIIMCPEESLPEIKMERLYRLHRNRPSRIIVRDYNGRSSDSKYSKYVKEYSEIWSRILREQGRVDASSWGREAGWRMALVFPTSLCTNEDMEGHPIQEDLQKLMPCKYIQKQMQKRGDGRTLNQIKTITFPSVLYLMQRTDQGKNDFQGIGMKKRAFNKRHVILSWQHRMHSEIAEFSFKNVYGKKALRTPPRVNSNRSWSYDRYPNRMIWIAVRRHRGDKDETYESRAEARQIIREIEEFYKYALKAAQSGGKKTWEIGVLAFYAHQESILKEYLRRFTGDDEGLSFFQYPQTDPIMTIDLQTVDSFQGHEADIVFVSMSNRHSTPFLSQPNRLNVMATRARYQCVMVGDIKSLSEGAQPPLKKLIDETEKMPV